MKHSDRQSTHGTDMIQKHQRIVIILFSVSLNCRDYTKIPDV